MASRIFEKEPRLKPSAMATVAERRFDDAETLCRTGENARANGVAYLAGFVIEILLKARLVERYPEIARKRQHEVTDAERDVWRLIWKQHDLEAMLAEMRELEAALKARGERDGQDYVAELKKVCASWTIQARYSSRMMLMDEATKWLERVRLLKELLK
jgi:glutathionylspermidine synthase